MKKEIKKRIAKLIGNVWYPESVYEETIVELEKKESSVVWSNKLKEKADKLFSINYLANKLDDGSISLTFLNINLLKAYTLEAFECLVLHRYFRALSKDAEVGLSYLIEYRSNKESLSLELKQAEANLLEYLTKAALNENFKARYRHLLSVWFLFSNYISDPVAVSALVKKFEERNFNFIIN